MGGQFPVNNSPLYPIPRTRTIQVRTLHLHSRHNSPPRTTAHFVRTDWPAVLPGAVPRQQLTTLPHSTHPNHPSQNPPPPFKAQFPSKNNCALRAHRLASRAARGTSPSTTHHSTPFHAPEPSKSEPSTSIQGTILLQEQLRTSCAQTGQPCCPGQFPVNNSPLYPIPHTRTIQVRTLHLHSRHNSPPRTTAHFVRTDWPAVLPGAVPRQQLTTLPHSTHPNHPSQNPPPPFKAQFSSKNNCALRAHRLASRA